jgi:Spy/CpxP family protein refolding chaperone
MRIFLKTLIERSLTMKWSKWIVFVLVMAMVLSVCIPVSAQGFGRGRRTDTMDREGRNMRPMGQNRDGFIFAGLNLTEDQKTQIANILVKYRDQRQSLHDALISAKKDLHSVVFAEYYNETDVRQAFQAMSAVKEELTVLRARVASEIRPVLTAEQIEILKQKKEKRGEKIKARHERKKAKMEAWLEEYAQ